MVGSINRANHSGNNWWCISPLEILDGSLISCEPGDFVLTCQILNFKLFARLKKPHYYESVFKRWFDIPISTIPVTITATSIGCLKKK
jgi:hypothetical protein